ASARLKISLAAIRDSGTATTSFVRRSPICLYSAESLGCAVENPVGSGSEPSSPKIGSWKTGCGSFERGARVMAVPPMVDNLKASSGSITRILQPKDDHDNLN